MVETVCPLICESTAMREVARRIERAAAVESPVLIVGEAGAGKKFVAELIHRRSRRGDGPFVIASTETDRSRLDAQEPFEAGMPPDQWVAAAGGTLLIDEIARLSPTLQAMLLDMLENRRAVGLNNFRGQPATVRLMATSRDELAESVESGCVRKDLYYRIAVVTIRVPPLRQRQEDIPRLVQEMLEEWCARHDKPAPTVDPDLMRYLIDYPWLGNGYELRDRLDTILSMTEAAVLEMRHLRAA